MITPASTVYPTLILVRGVPGSGKSYLADELKKTIGKDLVEIIDPDTTDYSSKEYHELSKAMTAEGVDAKFHPYRFLRSKAYKAIDANKILVWNQAFTSLDGFNKTIVNLQAYAEDHHAKLPVLVVEIEITEDTARSRVKKREKQGGHGVPDDAFARFLKDYVTFANEGYNIVVVNGEDAVSKSTSAVIAALKNSPKQ